MNLSGLTIERGQRHCKIQNAEGETVFKTTSFKDAEHYVDLCNEIARLQALLDSRGIAPHRIYLLSRDEQKRGRVNQENLPAYEVVITAKADDGVVVRRLHDGKEEIVDLDELEPIPGGSYLRGAADIHDESVNIVVRFSEADDSVLHVAVFRDKDNADELVSTWQKEDEAPGPEYIVNLMSAEGEKKYYVGDASIDD